MRPVYCRHNLPGNEPVIEILRKIQIDRPGGYDALKLIEAPLPAIGDHEVLITVKACGVNYADGIIRMGLYASAKELHGYPITPGFELSGVVTAIGANVTDHAIGDEVLALTLFGGYCSHIVLKSDRVFRKPANLSHAQAAALPTVFLTAWFMVREQVLPKSGDAWLVHSAAGGVGSALCQLGRLHGCRVVGVVGSAHKRSAALAMGADLAIDKSTQNLWPEAERLAPKGFQAIFDANGVSTLAQSYAHLAPMGKLCIYGFASMLPHDGRLNWLKMAWDWLRTPRFNPLNMTQSNKSVLAANLSFLSEHAGLLRSGMLELIGLFENGQLVAPPVTEYPLADSAKAQADIESGKTIGKLVLIP
jgi:NADPH:quinone reductase-like Zn-dependent oxidoreductase